MFAWLIVALCVAAFVGWSIFVSWLIKRDFRKSFRPRPREDDQYDLQSVVCTSPCDPTQLHKAQALAAPPAPVGIDCNQPKTHKHMSNTTKPPALVLNSDSDSLAEDVGPEVEAKAQIQDHTQMDAGCAGGGGDGHCCLPWWHNANEGSTQADYPKQKPPITSTLSGSVVQQPKGLSLSGVQTCAADAKGSGQPAPNCATPSRGYQFGDGGDAPYAPPPVKRYKLMGGS